MSPDKNKNTKRRHKEKLYNEQLTEFCRLPSDVKIDKERERAKRGKVCKCQSNKNKRHYSGTAHTHEHPSILMHNVEIWCTSRKSYEIQGKHYIYLYERTETTIKL